MRALGLRASHTLQYHFNDFNLFIEFILFHFISSMNMSKTNTSIAKHLQQPTIQIKYFLLPHTHVVVVVVIIILPASIASSD